MMKPSRPEIVLFLGAMLLLGGTLTGAGLAARAWQLRRMATRDFRSMEIAIYDYREQQKKLPVRGNPIEDVRFGTPAAPNRNLCSVLLGVPGQGGDLNPGNIRYLRVGSASYRRSGINDKGDLLDPWGLPYQIVLDADDNNVCDLPGTRLASAIGVPVAMWSNGPDQKPGTPDDIISWR
jgi:hypothetical protein